MSGAPSSIHNWKHRFFFVRASKTGLPLCWGETSSIRETQRPKRGFSLADEAKINSIGKVLKLNRNFTEDELKFTKPDSKGTPTAESLFSKLSGKSSSSKRKNLRGEGSSAGPTESETAAPRLQPPQKKQKTQEPEEEELIVLSSSPIPAVRLPSLPPPVPVASSSGAGSSALQVVASQFPAYDALDAPLVPSKGDIIGVSSKVFGDDLPVKALYKKLAEFRKQGSTARKHEEEAVRALQRRIAVQGEKLNQLATSNQDLEDRLAKVESLEEGKRADLEKEIFSLKGEVELLQAQLESSKAADKAEIEALRAACAKAEEVGKRKFVESQACATLIQGHIDSFQKSAEFARITESLVQAGIAEYKRSTELGRVFVDVLAEIRVAGFTLGAQTALQSAKAAWTSWKEGGADMEKDPLSAVNLSELEDFDEEAQARGDALASQFGLNLGFSDDEPEVGDEGVPTDQEDPEQADQGSQS